MDEQTGLHGIIPIKFDNKYAYIYLETDVSKKKVDEFSQAFINAIDPTVDSFTEDFSGAVDAILDRVEVDGVFVSHYEVEEK